MANLIVNVHTISFIINSVSKHIQWARTYTSLYSHSFIYYSLSGKKDIHLSNIFDLLVYD